MQELKIFLSSKDKKEDKEFALKIYNIFKRAGIYIWSYLEDLRPGDYWDETIENALNKCNCLIVVLSEDAVESQEIKNEVNYFINKKKKIIPIVFRNCEIPYRWQQIQYIDFTNKPNLGFIQLFKALDIDEPEKNPKSFNIKIKQTIKIQKKIPLSKKILICTHGTGHYKNNFIDEWIEIFNKNHDPQKFIVKGLYWGDFIDELYEKYFDLNSELHDQVKSKFLKNIYSNLDSTKNNEEIKLFEDFAYASFAYLYFNKFRDQTIWPKCIIRLYQLIEDTILKEREKDNVVYHPILIGHSLGAILFMHITWFIKHVPCNLNYFDFFILGSPLGMKSYLNNIPDYLKILQDIGNHTSKLSALSTWANEWLYHNRKRLHIINNQHDFIASEVYLKMNSGREINIFPMGQNFTESQKKYIEEANPDTLVNCRFGERHLSKIIYNHDIKNYLNSKEFKNELNNLL